MTRKTILVCLISALLVTMLYQVPVAAHGGDDDDEFEIRIRQRGVIQVPVVVQPAFVVIQGVILAVRLDGLNTILILSNGGFAQPVLVTAATIIVFSPTIRARDVVEIRGVRNKHGTIVARRIKVISRRRG